MSDVTHWRRALELSVREVVKLFFNRDVISDIKNYQIRRVDENSIYSVAFGSTCTPTCAYAQGDPQCDIDRYSLQCCSMYRYIPHKRSHTPKGNRRLRNGMDQQLCRYYPPTWCTTPVVLMDRQVCGRQSSCSMGYLPQTDPPATRAGSADPTERSARMCFWCSRMWTGYS